MSNEEDLRMSRSPRPIIVSEPSGVGRGTLVNRLLAAHPHKFSKTLSHTTRKPREGEKEGEDCCFIDEVCEVSSRSWRYKNVFVETMEYNGNYYASSYRTIVRQVAFAKVPVVETDVDGVRQIKESEIKAHYVFIMPSHRRGPVAKLRSRNTETEEGDPGKA